MTEKTKCAGQIRIPGVWPRFRNCTRTAKNHEDGKDWCAQHTPSLVKARDAERTASRNAEWAAKERASKHAMALADARAAVVEAAKAWAASANGAEWTRLDNALRDAVNALEALERDHA